MTLRPLLAAATLLAAPAALANAAWAQPGSETTTSSTATRTTQTTRKVERTRPHGTPLKPRVIEAPGAALMMIPASYDPTQNGPFSQF